MVYFPILPEYYSFSPNIKLSKYKIWKLGNVDINQISAIIPRTAMNFNSSEIPYKDYYINMIFRIFVHNI